MAMPTYQKKPVDFVIDVRSRVEFWLGHLPNATCVPVDTLPEGLEGLDGLTKQSRILVYCASGGRSAMAKQVLNAEGYQHVTNAGGIGEARPDFAA